MNTRDRSEPAGKDVKHQPRQGRVKLFRRTSEGEEPEITEDDTLYDETIRHTVPPPAQVNRG